MVSCNNTWRNICDEASVSMNAPNEQGICHSAGSLVLKNYICHPLVALLFRVEYTARIGSGQGSEKVFFTLGWTLHLPDINMAGELKEELKFTKVTLGPGSTPSGDLLWNPNSDDHKVYEVLVSAYMSTDSAPPHPSVLPNGGNVKIRTP